MGKLMLLLVIATTLSGMLLHGNVQETISKANERFVEHGSTMLAREVAMTGMNGALQMASGQFSSGSYGGTSPWNGTFNDGAYNVTLTAQGSGIEITSVGTFGNEQYTIARYYDYVSGSGGVPDFMKDAISCNGDITVQNDLNVLSPGPSENANIHANGNITFDGGTSTIQGFGNYGGSLALNTSQTAEDIFQPVDNPGGAPLHEQVDPISFPILNAASYESIATQVTNGNVFLFGTKVMGTKENPKIWYINGDVMTVTPTTFTGYGVILVNGNFNINHNISSDASTESTLGVYVEGNINVLSSALTLDGQWYVDGLLLPGSNTTFQGTVSSSSGSCNFSTPFSIGYLPANPALTDPFWSGGGGGAGYLKLAESREW